MRFPLYQHQIDFFNLAPYTHCTVVWEEYTMGPAKRHSLLVLIGQEGVGKSTLCVWIAQTYSFIRILPILTTAPEPEDENQRKFFNLLRSPISEATFETGERQKRIIASDFSAGYKYGIDEEILKETLEAAIGITETTERIIHQLRREGYGVIPIRIKALSQPRTHRTPSPSRPSTLIEDATIINSFEEGGFQASCKHLARIMETLAPK